MTSEESAWLFHDIGRCYCELGKWQEAKEYGEKSLTAARDAKDEMWQLNASVMIGQSEGNCLLRLAVVHCMRHEWLLICS